ncbi:type IV secretion system protein [Candidatus Bartonella washoeensis]|uniref:P-type DNA transfer protein VirB5 n=1 Tax=Cardidatus Bartonella washoeensis 085-0475 TaxID=1094564 RepID=J1JKT2_9HYPH|nr:type IV secretion system protein [Bartonella washoeensis]EJF84850.1 hypothetical protein MCW_01144 [Bartonella washoeensis 085-0475]
MKRIIISITIAAILGTPNLALAWLRLNPEDSGVSYPNNVWLFGATTPPSKPSVPTPPKLQNPKKQERTITPLIDLLKKQLEVKKEHLEQTKKMYGSITGNRDLGISQEDYGSFFLKNPQWIYNKDRKSDISISVFTSFHDILKQEEISGPISEVRQAIEGRSQYAAVVDKAVSLEVFQQTEGRFEQISKLVEQINKADDLKSITELQARIKGKLAMIQNETTKLQMVTYLRNAERTLINQQKHNRNLKILNSKNATMPTIRSIR